MDVMKQLSITYRKQFAAAHRLTGMRAAHKCSELHGHNYTLEVTVSPGAKGFVNGLVIDTSDLQVAIGPVLARVDHKTLNEAEISGPEAETLKAQPSAENLALWFWAALKFIGNDGRLTLRRVRVYETDHLWADVDAPTP